MHAPVTEIATLAGGCFWCLEAVFQPLEGVIKVESGYAGGTLASPSYQQVCTGRTGHAEVVQVSFDPAKLSYHELLEIFFAFHDPTTMNRQGADVGTQYRSAIFYHGASQKETAEKVIRELTAQRTFGAPIVTQVVPFTQFYKAEGYHQDYYRNNSNESYCRAVIRPKLEKFDKKHAKDAKP